MVILPALLGDSEGLTCSLFKVGLIDWLRS